MAYGLSLAAAPAGGSGSVKGPESIAQQTKHPHDPNSKQFLKAAKLSNISDATGREPYSKRGLF